MSHDRVEQTVRELLDIPEDVGESLDGVHGKIFDAVHGNTEGEDTSDRGVQ